MPETKKVKKQKKSDLVGSQAKATTLDKTNAKLDIDTLKSLPDALVEASFSNGIDLQSLEQFTSISNSRDQMYSMIDTMAADSTVSSIIKTFAADACEYSDNGHIMWCESPDSNISKYINYLLNIMNVDKNLYNWTYNLIKYGDVYLKLFRESDYQDLIFKKDKVDTVYSSTHSTLNESKMEENINLSAHKSSDPYSYYVEMVADPGTMFELTKYGKTYGYIETPNATQGLASYNSYIGGDNSLNFNNYKLKSDDINIYQADDFVHAYLEDNNSRFPETVNLFVNQDDYNSNKNAQNYLVRRGKSMLIDSYKIWREKSLLETATLMNRLTKSSMIRNVQVEVGDMPKSQVQSTLRRIKELFEQKSAYNVGSSMQEYTNPGPIENNIFTATHDGKGAITVNSTGGDVDVKNLADLDWWNNKFYASYGIPKAFFGWTEDAAGFNGGSSLSIISSTYAKGVKRIQNSMLQAITDCINLFLINKGCYSYINNFTLKMKAPLSQDEKDYRENLTNRISAISNLQSLFGDIEDKERKLEITKALVGTLNYGDQLTQVIDEEIKAAHKAKIKEQEEAAKKEELENTPTEEEPSGVTEPPSTGEDLGNSSVTNESLSPEKSLENLIEDSLTLTEDNLPTPEELDKNKDFTENDGKAE
jgi:hypothetical protein